MIVFKGSIAGLVTVILMSVANGLLTTSSWKTLRKERTGAGVCGDHWDQEWDLCPVPSNDSDTSYSFGAHAKYFYTPLTYSRYYCSCHSNCSNFGDCCINAALAGVGGDGDEDEKRKESIFGCKEVTGTSFSIFTASKCARDWDVSHPFKANIANKCFAPESGSSSGNYLNDIPVYSNWTGNFYANIFCAICNNDAANFKKWSVDLKCTPIGDPLSAPKPSQLLPLPKEQFAESGTYDRKTKSWIISINGTDYKCALNIKDLVFPTLIRNYGARLCRHYVQDCSHDWKEESTRKKCGAYTAYLFERDPEAGNFRTFKNYHCALCNNVNATALSCNQHIQAGLLEGRAGVSKIRTNKADTSQLWYPLVLDFKSGDSQLVGEICSLEKGQLYDPLQEKCIDIFCGKLYQWDESFGRCVSSDLRTNATQGNTTQGNFTQELTQGLTNDCFKTSVKNDGFVIFENGSVFVNQSAKVYGKSEYEVHVNNSLMREILICAEDLFIHFPINQLQIQAIASELFLYISIACLTLHLIAYTLVPKLRNLPGKILASFSVSLIGAHASFLMAGNVTPDPMSCSCLVLSVSAHYFFLCSFFWMNVMAFDVSSTFHSLKTSDQQSDFKLFIKYFIYAWFGPMLIIGAAVYLDVFWETSAYRPRYGYKICWINQKKGLLVFFVLPLALILMANVAFFLSTSYLLIKSNREVKMLRKSDKIRFVLYLKLGLIMGLTWIFGFMGALSTYESLWIPFIFFNGLQGAFIFAAFTCKRRNWQHIAGKLKPSKGSKTSSAIQNTTRTVQTSVNTSSYTVNVIN